jgi:hypothetical protein
MNITLEKITYHGWNDSWLLSNGRINLVVVPDISRIMEYSLDGDNIIWHNPDEYGKTYPLTEKSYHFGGSRAVFGSEDIWGKFNDYILDHGKSNIEIDSTEEGLPLVRMIYGPGFRCGAQITREIIMHENGDVDINHKLTNISADVIEYGLWEVCQTKSPCFAAFPINPKSKYENGIYNIVPISKDDDQFSIIDGYSITEYKGKLGKIGADSDGPFMFWASGKLGHLKIFKPMDRNYPYPDDGCSVQVYTNNKDIKGEAFLELEVLGPMIPLKTGDSSKLKETWKIFDLPETVKDKQQFLNIIKRFTG